ncbi:zincin [Serendipita vermifera]|nr:zincin [Serendipita vermifera]
MLVAIFAFALCCLTNATPLKRAPGLVVTLSSNQASINSIGDISLTATVENTSSEDIKVLRIGTVLDSLPTRSFIVTKDGSEVAFKGVIVQTYTSSLTEDHFVAIPAGGEVSVTHGNIAQLYDFESAGTGTFSFTPTTDFQIANTDTAVHDLADTLLVSTRLPTVDVNIVSDVTRRGPKVLDKRSMVNCTDTSSSPFISASYEEAKSLASLAANYISTRGADDPLFVAYFGAQDISRPLSVFQAVESENDPERTLNCSDPYDVCWLNVIAYTVLSTTNIYYCPIFYNEVAPISLCEGADVAARNLRGGTTLHELSHAAANTTDITYGCANDQTLAKSNATLAANNADNYNCFVAQIYADTQC